MAKASKKDPKAPKEGGEKKGSGLMGLVRLAGFALSIVSALVLSISLLDMGFIDLRPTLHAFSGAAAGALIFFTLLTGFAGSRVAAAKHAALDAQIVALKGELEGQLNAELQAKAEALGSSEAEVMRKLTDVEQRVEKFLGAEYERLVAENEDYRKEIDQSRVDEVSKASEEVEALRAKNQELQEKINKWAVESVDSKLSQEKLHAA